MSARAPDVLLAPIPGDAPFGTYLKADRAYFRALRTTFNAAQSAFRALSETADSLRDRDLLAQNRAAWQRLSEASEEALTARSKDLEVACWYLAAQVHLDRPLERLAAGAAAVADLIERDWDRLHPLPPADTLAGPDDAARTREIDALRLRPFVQLFGETPGSGLLHLPLTHLPVLGALTADGLQAAERDGRLADLRPEAGAAATAEAADLTVRLGALRALEQALHRLDALLRARAQAAGEAPVQIAPLAALVTAILRLVQQVTAGSGYAWPLDDAGPAAPPAEAAEAGAEPPAGPAAAAQAAVKAAVPLSRAAAPADREAALARLEDLIAVFRATEPHSPVHTLLARALRWARMPLPDLMGELLGQDSAAFGQVSMMAGLESAGQPVARPAATPLRPPPSPPPPRDAGPDRPAPSPAAADPPVAAADAPQPPSETPRIASFQW